MSSLSSGFDRSVVTFERYCSKALVRLIESNAKAIEAATNQQQIDRELVRLDREAYLELARQSREELQESRDVH